MLSTARRPADRGFTLIEILVVIAIIGILAAIAIPVFLGVKNQATDAAVREDLATLNRAVVVHAMGNSGEYAPVASLKKDGFAGPSVDYPAGGAPSYATSSGPTSDLPAARAKEYCVVATSPTGTVFFATHDRSVTVVGARALCS